MTNPKSKIFLQLLCSCTSPPTTTDGWWGCPRTSSLQPAAYKAAGSFVQMRRKHISRISSRAIAQEKTYILSMDMSHTQRCLRKLCIHLRFHEWVRQNQIYLKKKCTISWSPPQKKTPFKQVKSNYQISNSGEWWSITRAPRLGLGNSGFTGFMVSSCLTPPKKCKNQACMDLVSMNLRKTQLKCVQNLKAHV